MLACEAWTLTHRSAGVVDDAAVVGEEEADAVAVGVGVAPLLAAGTV
jgi:hypothetical protein